MKRVVVLGGGFAGRDIAKKLQEKFEVILIDNKEYFEFTPSILRTIVEPNHIKNIQSEHKKYLPKVNVINGEIKEVSPKHVNVNGENIEYEYLCICLGSRYESPIKDPRAVITNRAIHLNKFSNKLLNANSVLIVGGGLVGVELASEISSKFKDKNITLVHSKERLMERLPIDASKIGEKFLKKNNVNIVYNSRIERSKSKNHLTLNGKKIEADIVFVCTGITPNSEILKNKFYKSLDENGRVKVNEYLQVEGYNNIFSAGDITNVNEEKSAQNASYQAQKVIKNIIRLESGKRLEEYKSKKNSLVISLGRKRGILVMGERVFEGWTIGLIKRIIEWKEMRKVK